MQGRRQQAGGEIVGLLIRFSLAVEFFPSLTPRSTQSLSYPLLSVASPTTSITTFEVGRNLQELFPFSHTTLADPKRYQISSGRSPTGPCVYHHCCHSYTRVNYTRLCRENNPNDRLSKVTSPPRLVNSLLKKKKKKVSFLDPFSFLPSFFFFFFLPTVEEISVRYMYIGRANGRTLISDRGYFYRSTIFT